MKTGRDARNNMSKAEFERKKKEVMESPAFKHAQKTLNDFNTHMQKNVKPVLDRMAQSHKQINTPYFGDTSISIPIARRDTTQQEILRELKILNQKKIAQKQIVSTEIVITYDAHDAVLSRIIDGKTYSLSFRSTTKRKKLFELFRQKKSYTPLKDLKVLLESPTHDSVSGMIKKLNDTVISKLKLKKVKFIVNNPGLGYKINPDILIERA